MRQTISGLVAAIAVVAASAVPALACGNGLFQGSCSPCGEAYGSPCAPPQVYVSPAPTYGDAGCNGGCGGWAYERLPDPVHQYYYVNQGPTYTGPGNFAPYPTYQESAVSGWDAYRRRPYYYGYDGGRYANAMNHRYDGAPNIEGPAIYSYRAHPHFRPSRARSGYYHAPRPSYRYGYAPRHGMRYGASVGAPRYYGHREHVQRHYN
jgi:hypothetical protein